MGLSIVRFRNKDCVFWGLLSGETIRVVKGECATLSEFLDSGIEQAKTVAAGGGAETVSAKEVELLSPVTRPARIICQGANYAAHRAESGMDAQRPPFNTIFSKADSSITGPYSDIVCPPHVRLLDYEIELGLVIGAEINRPIRITDDNLHEYVAGLVIANDVSARDVQIPQGQWLKGKSYRTFCPVGPVLYLWDKEDVPLIHDLELRLSVNGEVRQQANTNQMLFKPAETLTELSEIMDLSPGDLVLTGTAGGVAMQLGGDVMEKMLNPVISGAEKMKLFVESQLNNHRYLKEGDVVRSVIGSADGRIQLGEQVNKVVSSKS